MIEKHQIAQISRATRTDKGVIRLTPRDLSGLGFCATMRAVRLDHLARWFAPDLVPAQKEEQPGPAYPPGQKRPALSWPRDPDRRLHAAYNVVFRWAKAGFAQTRALYLHQPRWVALTTRGLQQLGLAYDATFPSLVELEHLYQVTHVRLTLAYLAHQRQTTSSIPVHAWISERELAAQQEEREAGIPVGHRPDGALRLQDGTLEAIEVELSPKPSLELHRILHELTASDSAYARVRYFVRGTATLHTMLQAHAQLEPDQQKRVIILQL